MSGMLIYFQLTIWVQFFKVFPMKWNKANKKVGIEVLFEVCFSFHFTRKRDLQQYRQNEFLSRIPLQSSEAFCPTELKNFQVLQTFLTRFLLFLPGKTVQLCTPYQSSCGAFFPLPPVITPKDFPACDPSRTHSSLQFLLAYFPDE